MFYLCYGYDYIEICRIKFKIAYITQAIRNQLRREISDHLEFDPSKINRYLTKYRNIYRATKGTYT